MAYEDLHGVKYVKYCVISLLLLALGGATVWFFGPPRQRGLAEIRVADGGQPLGAALYIAHRLGYFSAEKLHVNRYPYPSGREALSELLNGQADIATVADTPLARAALDGGDFVVIATLGASSKGVGIISRKSVASTPADLIGKRIGYTEGEITEYFLQAYFVRNEIIDKDPKRLDAPPAQLMSDLLAGKLDVVCVWEPFLSTLKRSLGNDGQIFFGDELHTWTWNLVASRAFVENHPGRTTRFLRALLRGEVFMDRSPDQARAIISQYSGADPKMLDWIWNSSRHKITLDQSLIVSLERQARWFKKSKPGGGDLPDFFKMMYSDPLETLDASRITIIR